jgi:predicted acetyltransferase
MKVKIVPIKIDDRNVLKEMLYEYEKEMLGGEPSEYKYLDSYWQKPNRFPFFIEVDEKIAGFVLINDYNLVNKNGKNIAEFYIRKEFRRNGVGKMTAIKVFDIFKGNWEIRELKDNIEGQFFWRKVIDKYTNGNFKEVFLDNENWQGPVQLFENL